MKLIIDIPDKVYNEYREGVMSMENNCIIGNAVFDGKPYEERPQGKWRVYEGVITCEECGTEAEEITPFCAWCGADMRGEK